MSLMANHNNVMLH